jgi:hypothetical protein
MTPQVRSMIMWCLLLVAQDSIALALAGYGSNNLWMTYVSWPIISGTLLWALSDWHPASSARLALRAAIPLVVVVSVILTVTIDNARTFSLVVAPFHSIVMLLAAMWTFVSLGLRENAQIMRQDWFWIVGGVMLYAATATAMQPLAWYLIRERVDLLHAAFNVRAGVVILSFAAITWGMLLRGAPRYSGGSSWPPSSPSSSSSAGLG